MSMVDPSALQSLGLVARVKAILLQPRATWDVIAAEPATVGGLYRSYVIPLALIPAVCGLIGSVVFGFGFFGVTYRPPIVASICEAILHFGLGLVSVYLFALIIDALAPNFGGTKDPMQAFKVAAYSWTAAWVAGVFGLIPALAILGLLGLYSFYLLYLGLPKLMKVSEDKAMGYTALVVVVAIVINIIIFGVLGSVTRMFTGPIIAHSGGVTGKVIVPGAGAVDMAKLQAATQQLDAASREAKAGRPVHLADPNLLKSYLPDAVAGFNRTDVSTESTGSEGLGAAAAVGTYAKGDARMRLTVSDMGAAGALAGIAGAFNVQSSHESNGQYEKVGKVDGRMTTESYDRTARHGEYSVLVGDRFMVHAEGDGLDMDALKSAVGAIDKGRLESLAKAST
jgi:hypothetical protein